MKAIVVVDPQNLVLRYVHRRAKVVVQRIGVGHDRVHEVVAAAKLHDHERRRLILMTVAVSCHDSNPPTYANW